MRNYPVYYFPLILLLAACSDRNSTPENQTKEEISAPSGKEVLYELTDSVASYSDSLIVCYNRLIQQTAMKMNDTGVVRLKEKMQHYENAIQSVQERVNTYYQEKKISEEEFQTFMEGMQELLGDDLNEARRLYEEASR